MGYACPVCETPQADARHLANHLAFTAMLHGDDHEDWLEEHVPDWESAGEDGLAARVREFADDADYPQVFEDTAGGLEEHDHDEPDERSGALFEEREPRSGSEGSSGHGPRDVDERAARERADADLDAETREVLEEARDLTREMLEEDDEDAADE